MCNRVMQYTKASLGAEHFVSYLPLSHIASQLIDIYAPLSSAGTVWFAQPDAMKVDKTKKTYYTIMSALFRAPSYKQ